MELPSKTPESAPTPAPPAEDVTNTNAPPDAVDLHDNDWGAPSSAPTHESYHGFFDESMELPTYGKYGEFFYQKGFKGKGHKGIRRQEDTSRSSLPRKARKRLIRMKMASMIEKSSKRLGTLMVRPLLKSGLSPH
jgi:hypothetical protein